MAQLQEKEHQLAESAKILSNAKKLVESKEREVRIIKESNLREKAMADLLGTLNEVDTEFVFVIVVCVTQVLTHDSPIYQPTVEEYGEPTTLKRSGEALSQRCFHPGWRSE
jgi:hypothetical protein